MSNQQRTSWRVDLGVAYGLIAGAALGAVVLALTGDPLWVWIGPVIGLLVGIVVAGALAGADRDDEVGAARSDAHGEDDDRA